MHKKILIVDDEESVLRILSARLKQEGFVVSESRDGEEGLKKAEKEHPDIILLDIIMPKMNGLVMLEKLRRTSWGKNAQVMILTNLSDGDELAEAMENRVYDFLVKADWKLEDLIYKIKEKLNVKQKAV